jgi:hypothetical protein
MAKVKKSSLQIFIDKGGYKIVAQDEKGNWRGKAEAARATGLGVMTVGRILKENPTEPNKGEAKYIQDFEEDRGWKNYRQMFGHLSQLNSHKSIIRDAWKFLGGKDSSGWQKEDYGKLFSTEKTPEGKFVSPFYNEQLGGTPEGYATPFHNHMRANEKEKFLAVFHGVKFPKGSKKEWYLQEADLIGNKETGQKGIIHFLTDNETLMLILTGINKGGRHSALIAATHGNINWEDSTMMDYEQKMARKGKPFVDRYIHPKVLQMLRKYVNDYKIPRTTTKDGLLFIQSYSHHMLNMKQAAKLAGLSLNVSTHILKHTFVTQGSRHKVSMEVIQEQTGTDIGTLSAHYKAGNPKKCREEIMGEKYEVETFPNWLNRIVPVFDEEYERIKVSGRSYGRAKI